MTALSSGAGGEFGALMQVHIQNDGPITLQFETPNIPGPKEVGGSAFLCYDSKSLMFF